MGGLTGNDNHQIHIFTCSNTEDANNLLWILSAKLKIPNLTGKIALSHIFPIDGSLWDDAVYSGPDLRSTYGYVMDSIHEKERSLEEGTSALYDLQDKSTFDAFFPSYWKSHESFKDLGMGALYASKDIALQVMDPDNHTRPATPAFRDGNTHVDD